MLDLFKTVSLVLVVIATINLGLTGLLGLDIVGKIIGGIPLLLKVFHILVGVSGILLLLTYLKK